MDQNTTNINELPIDNNPPENREMPNDIPHTIDRTIQPIEEPEKHVRFTEEVPVYRPPKASLYELSETNKIIILASIFFLLFNDSKVKNYIISILVVMFGNMLKSSTGGLSKIGLIFYSIVYGCSLFILINVIEIIIDKYN
jgi:hypothetical protein